ncbi:MAG: cobalamin biosynthesis protein CobD [Notoacmeibacter sp.]|nr:cobalamin biosynthesis protein CobD [Notoacmeibacter sp.]MCC0031986.1 cobalamin biosynthesis protein CobD [Brucellaceae bacterium]
MSFALSMLVALAIDSAVGWPDALHRRTGHPVTWIGALVSTLDQAWNRGDARQRLFAGLAACLATLLLAAGAGALLWFILPGGLLGAVLAGVLAWPLLAVRSMHDHVAAVEKPLAAGDLAGARHAVSMIVGRDPAQLDEAGVARAAIESLAENTSDGIAAPLFWGVVAGLPGIAAYKAINTLDSMIGHRSERHLYFGRASARLDDLANLAPARLSGALFACVSAAPLRALSVMFRDAGKHRSPNAGWPEAAVAAALGVRLSGPRAYHGATHDEPWLNGDARDPDAADLTRALPLYRRFILALFVLLTILVIIL